MIDIKRKNESPTGWAAYVAAFKAKHPDAIIDYKNLMQQYIKGVPLKEIPV
jgi:hypothetical protein